MGRKRKSTALISVAVAGAAVVALLIAGTVLRMHTRNMDFMQALGSFVSDTFNAGA